MTNPFVIDARHDFPLIGNWQEVAQRQASNMVSTWTERLCLSQTNQGYALSVCIFGALGEETSFTDEEFEETDLSLPPDYLPAFYEGELVSLREDGYICGPLLVWGDGTVVEFMHPREQVIQDACRQLEWSFSAELLEKIVELTQSTKLKSALPTGLMEAYLSTSYQAEVPNGSCVLNVGSPSQKLLEVYADSQTESAAFITAQNPLGCSLTDEENRLRVNALLTDTKNLGLLFFEGEGIGADDSWDPERSVLLLGLTFEQAVHLGRHHQQNAIIWADEDAVPKLVLLR